MKGGYFNLSFGLLLNFHPLFSLKMVISLNNGRKIIKIGQNITHIWSIFLAKRDKYFQTSDKFSDSLELRPKWSKKKFFNFSGCDIFSDSHNFLIILVPHMSFFYALFTGTINES
jgi:hypothetical protein